MQRCAHFTHSHHTISALFYGNFKILCHGCVIHFVNFAQFMHVLICDGTYLKRRYSWQMTNSQQIRLPSIISDVTNNKKNEL